MGRNRSQASKIQAWADRLLGKKGHGEHPLAQIIEDPTGLPRYKKLLLSLSDNDPRKIKGLKALADLERAWGKSIEGD